jgi:hypothetical protein
MKVKSTLKLIEDFISNSYHAESDEIYSARQDSINNMWKNNNNEFNHDEYSRISNIYSKNMQQLKTKFEIFQ